MLTTNIVESMNSVLLEARELHILRMMDFIQVKLQHWLYERRNKAEGTFYDVSCWVEEELKKRIDLAFTLNVSIMFYVYIMILTFFNIMYSLIIFQH